MLWYVALQAIPARRHTFFPPILAATVPLVHAAVVSARAFRPSAVEAAAARSTTRAIRTTSRFTETLPIGQMGLIPDQVRPVGTRTAESTNAASNSTPLLCGLQRTASTRRAEKPAQVGDAAARRATQEVGAGWSRVNQRSRMSP